MRLKFTTALLLAVIAPATFGGSIPGISATTINNPPSFSDLATGPDGNVWFTAWKENAIGRITPGPNFTLFPLPTANSTPLSIAVGVDGNLWFTEQSGKVGRITTSGAITEFPVATGDFLEPIVAVGDGSLWFLDRPRQTSATPPNSLLGRITTDGQLTSYPLGNNDDYESMIAGPDGNVWLFDFTKNAMVKVSTKDGTVAGTFPMTASAGTNHQTHIVRGQDGNIWMTHGDSSIARIKVNGTVTEYTVPTASSMPTGLNVSGDGTLLFTEYNTGKIGQLVVASATDSGQATINESDAILDKSSITLVSLPGALRATASSAFPISTEATLHPLDDDPCVAQTKVVTTSEPPNSPKTVTITVPPQKLCADIQASGYINVVEKRGGFTETSVFCQAFNAGPSTATNVVATCNATGGLILSQAKVSDNCKFKSDDGGYVLTADSLAKGEFCTLTAGFDLSTTESNALTIVAVSETFDPKMENNAYLYVRDSNAKIALKKPFNPLLGPFGERGH